MDTFTCAFAADLHAGLSAPEQDDIVADAEKRAENALSDALAVTKQQDHRSNAPYYSQHGEGRAQAVAHQRKPALGDDFLHLHHSYLRHSTGVSSAARLAGYMPAATVITASVTTAIITGIAVTTGEGTKSGLG